MLRIIELGIWEGIFVPVKHYKVGRRVEFSGILAFDWKCDNTNEQAFLRWRIKVHAVPWVLEHLVFQFLEI